MIYPLFIINILEPYAGSSRELNPRPSTLDSDAAAKRVDSEAGARLAAAEKEVESLKKLEAERCV